MVWCGWLAVGCELLYGWIAIYEVMLCLGYTTHCV